MFNHNLMNDVLYRLPLVFVGIVIDNGEALETYQISHNNKFSKET